MLVRRGAQVGYGVHRRVAHTGPGPAVTDDRPLRSELHRAAERERGRPIPDLDKQKLAVLGGKDPYTPPDDIEKLRDLTNVETALYPEAEHGFAHAPERPSHRADDAADAWSRALNFLKS